MDVFIEVAGTTILVLGVVVGPLLALDAFVWVKDRLKHRAARRYE